MNRRNVLIGLGVVGVIVVVVAIVAYSYFQNLIAPKKLEISYATVQTDMPEGVACAGGGEKPGVAKEILNLESDIIYVAGGENPMPDDVWASYTFMLPVIKNSTRLLLFQGSCFFRSPGVVANCQGDDCFPIETLYGYTWLPLTTVQGNDCYPDAKGCRSDVVDPGYVSINTIAKCHRIVYDGPVIYELSDGTGNRYVMHATATGTPDLNPTLPDGWTLKEVTIDEPLVVLPFGGGDNCYFNIIRDNLVQSYHQFAYSTSTYPPTN